MDVLNQFLDEFRIDVDALKRMKKRVFVVGRFNLSKQGGDPDLFLFTGRKGLSDRYLRSFTGVHDLSYDSFVRALKPAIAERIDRNGRFPSVVQEIPRAAEQQEAASVIDVFNYFFQRAVANTDQEEFKHEEPGHGPQLLRSSEKERGKSILMQIRKYLRTFCEFQPRTHEIVESTAQLLGSIASEHGLPPFEAGGALPGGFPEKLIDYVYAEDTRSAFALEGLNLLSPPWDSLTKNDRARQSFCDAVSGFREALLATPNRHYRQPYRGRPLSQWADDSIPDDLRKAFANARNSFNGLRQILRSKVLLSMVLEWMLDEYRKLDPVQRVIQQHPKNKNLQDLTVEKLILEEAEKNDLAPPVKRPTREERRRFNSLLTTNFEELLEAIVGSDAEFAKRLAKLPGELKKTAAELRADTTKRGLLRAISAKELGADMHAAFIDASRTILLDVLCPVLYRNPILTEKMLKRYFKQETMAAYLTAVFLADSSEDAVRKIAEDHLEFFESKIDKATKQIGDVDQVLSRVLSSFMDLLAAPEIQRRLQEGICVLREVHALMENSGRQEGIGAGGVSAIYHFDEKTALELTAAPADLVRETVPALARARLDRKLAVRGAAAKSAEETKSATASAALKGEGWTSGATEAEMDARDESEAPAEAPTRLTAQIDEILDKVVGGPVTEVTDKQKEAWAQAASSEILRNEEFVGGLANDVRAFERTLHLIYSRYADTKHADKKTFRNKVERMTLVNLMLLFKRDLGLGRVCSNLYQMLLDLVVESDPEAPDPRDFMRKHSLTEYFDGADIEKGGITALRQTLEVQASQSLQNIVSFVSELRGVKYLMDKVAGDADAELVVVNASAQEFLQWIRSDNLVSDAGQGRLRSSALVKGTSEKCVQPGLVCLTDIAFASQDKQGWLKSLAGAVLKLDDLSVVLPPICLSTTAQSQGWLDEGKELAREAAAAPAPVIVLGPSARLNPERDGFPTILPAGYLFAAHFLSRPRQLVKIENVGKQSEKRFRIIGFGAATMDESLETVLWGRSDKTDQQCFAADYYLYVVLTILATAARSGMRASLDPNEFYGFFVKNDLSLDAKPWESSALLNDALIGGKALRFSMDDSPLKANGMLTGVTVWEKERGKTGMRISDIGWFNKARESAQLP